MAGLPGDSLERWQQTAAAVLSLKPDTLRIYPTVVLQGTELEREIQKTEEEIQAVYKRMQSCLTQHEECQSIRQNLQTRTGDLKSEAAVRENDIRHNQETLSRIAGELAALKESDARREEEALRREEERTVLEDAGEALHREAEQLRQELLHLSQEQAGYSDRLEEANARVNQLALDISRQNMLILTRDMNSSWRAAGRSRRNLLQNSSGWILPSRKNSSVPACLPIWNRIWRASTTASKP